MRNIHYTLYREALRHPRPIPEPKGKLSYA